LIPWEAPLASSPVAGTVDVPGSKSATARSLVLAALADAPGSIHGALDSRDTSLMRAALGVLGVTIQDAGSVLHVSPPTEFTGGGVVDCGLAGTVMRFLPPLAALASPDTTFRGDAEAESRPMAPLLGALAALGARVSEPYRLPFTVGGDGVRGGPVSLDASGSSQFVSGLLLAGARFPDGLDVRHTGATLPSLPHIAMTVRMLRARGVTVDEPAAHGPVSWRVHPGPIAELADHIEPDLTNAATLLAAAVATGGRLTTRWPEGSLQAADDLAAALAAGLEYREGDAGRLLTVTGPGRVRAVDLDLHAISEFTPVAAALACLGDGVSTIRGVAHVRGHETDRLAALERELGALGAAVRQTADGLEITPRPLRGTTFHTWADQRMAHAGALLGLVTPGVVLDDVGCATKTLPDFPGLWTSLLGAA
jgi:3-phosphoshikimate 1-carboxyvinyltransferase